MRRAACASISPLFGLVGLAAASACGDEVFVESSGHDGALDGRSDAVDAGSDAVGTATLPCGTARCRVPEETCCINPASGGSLSAVLGNKDGKCVPYAACLPP